MGSDKGMGPIYMAANRNKRSLCLDLKKPAAVTVLKDMIKGADLFIHNSRPQAIERLGLGYEDLKKVNPRSSTPIRWAMRARGPTATSRPSTTWCRASAAPPRCSRGSTACRRASCRA